MKSLPPYLQAHLDEGTTTLAWCWRITRADGARFGFTDHDRSLSFDGTAFEPESGLTASEVRSGSDLSVDAQDAQGVLTSDRITETDILDGRWDNATVEVWRVNWAAPAQRVLLRRGAIGQIRRGRLAFVAEVRSLAHVRGQTVGRTFQATCDAALGMPQANLTAQQLGLGGATADTYNRLSVNTPAVLLNNVGAGIEATVNKAAAGNDAAFAFKTGFSARALIGLLGNDDLSFKVSPDGATFFDAIRIDRTSGQVELPQPAVLPGLAAPPSPPPTGKAAVYARNRAGAPWIDVMRPSGRDFPLQPHFGVNRIANWAPSTSTTITTEFALNNPDHAASGI